MEIEEYLVLPQESQFRLIKRLIYETVPKGEVKETAAAAGLEDYTLYKMRDGNQDDYHLLRRELPLILHHRGDLRLLHWLAQLFRCALFPLPRAAATPAQIYREIGRTTKAVGELLEVLTGALDDDSQAGREIARAEFLEIKGACAAAHARLASLEEAARLAQGGRKVVKGEEFPVTFPAQAGAA